MNDVRSPSDRLRVAPIGVEPGRGSRLTVWGAIAAALATVLIGFMVIAGVSDTIDRELLSLIALRAGRDSEMLIAAAQMLSWLSDTAQRTTMVLLIAAWLLWIGRRRAAIVIMVVPVVAAVSNSLLKEMFGRARPDIVPHLDLIGNLAYPSGHASNAMAFFLLSALLIARRHPARWAVVAIFISILVGMTRLLLGVHWPSDVIGGWLWGLAFALGGWRLAAPR